MKMDTFRDFAAWIMPYLGSSSLEDFSSLCFYEITAEQTDLGKQFKPNKRWILEGLPDIARAELAGSIDINKFSKYVERQIVKERRCLLVKQLNDMGYCGITEKNFGLVCALIVMYHCTTKKVAAPKLLSLISPVELTELLDSRKDTEDKTDADDNKPSKAISPSESGFHPLPMHGRFEMLPPGSGESRISPGNYVAAFNLSDLVDRVEPMAEIATKLKQEKLPVYIHAIGGLGKSVVAQAFCHAKAGEKFKYKFWVEAVSQDVREDIMRLELFDFNRNLESNEVTADFRRFASQHGNMDENVLLVIDNVVSLAQLQSIEGKDGLPLLRWHVLVTTRAVIDDPVFMRRVISLQELTECCCKDLFYAHYEGCSDEDKEEDAEVISSLLKRLNHHTYLVKLIAKIGHRVGYSPSELLSFVEERGVLHEDLQEEIYAEDKSGYSTIYTSIKSLFNHSMLTAEERTILSYFSLLPDQSIESELLAEWMADDNLTQKRVLAIFRRLTDNGWLIQMKEKGSRNVAYKCHSLIQTAIRGDGLQDPANFSSFLKNLTDYFAYNYDERDYLDQLRNIHCAEAVMNCFAKDSVALFDLKIYYVRLLNEYTYKIEAATEIATYLADNYEAMFPECQDTYEWRLRRLITMQTQSMVIVNVPSYDRYNKNYERRQRNFTYAQTFLNEDDYWYLQVKREVAMSCRNLERFDEALLLFQSQKAQLEQLIDQHQAYTTPEGSRWVRMYTEVLSGLGLTYNRMYEVESDSSKKMCLIQAAIDVRTQWLAIAHNRYAPDSDYMRKVYNDLGMSYLYLYSETPNPEYLDKAEELLHHSYQIRLAILGEESILSAAAIGNLSRLLMWKGKLYEALALAEKAIAIRRRLSSTQKAVGINTDQKRIAHYSLKIYTDLGDDSYLSQGFASAKDAVALGDEIYGSNKMHASYKESLDLYDQYLKLPQFSQAAISSPET